MNKPHPSFSLELPLEHIERINFAVKSRLGAKKWEPISLLSGGLTGVPVYKIKAGRKSYTIKLEDISDKNFDLVRNYEIVATVSSQGISPTVYFTDARRGIVLMRYIEPKPRPQASPFFIKKFAKLIRRLHDQNSFQAWKSVVEINNYVCQSLTREYIQKSIINKSIQVIKQMEKILFDPNDIRSCHCDLNPSNVLFDGKDYFLVDWQAASPQSFYFDLACCATWYYFYSEEYCDLFLKYYLCREASSVEKAKYYLMRLFVNIYFGMGFIALPLKMKPDIHALKDEEIEKLPTYLAFMQSIGSGQVDITNANTQQQFGFIFLKSAENMINHRYQQACELLSK